MAHTTKAKQEQQFTRDDMAGIIASTITIVLEHLEVMHQIEGAWEDIQVIAERIAEMIATNYHTGRPHPVPPSLRFAFEQMEGKTFPAPAQGGS